MAIAPGKTMARRKRSEHYVNNKEFLAALVKYREDVEIRYIKKYGEPPDKVGRASKWAVSYTHLTLPTSDIV